MIQKCPLLLQLKLDRFMEVIGICANKIARYGWRITCGRKSGSMEDWKSGSEVI